MLNVQADARFRAPPILFFGIGAQKCGTTWLHQYLARHDEVSVPKGKELHYWNGLRGDVQARIRELKPLAEHDHNARVQLKILRNRDAAHTSYADALFHRYAGQKVAGEITPDYAQLPEADLARLAALNPDTRFIFLMRDPLERLHSNMRKRMRGRAAGDRKLTFAGDAVIEELRAVMATRQAIPVQRSRYEKVITALENVAAPEKIGLFFYEDIFGNRNADAVCDFLSIARMPGNFEHVANSGNPVDEEGMAEFQALAMPLLAPTYDFMASRFGDALPAAWRRVMR